MTVMPADIPAFTYDSSDESWARLFDVLQRYDIAVFLGAGIGAPNRLPSWPELTSRLCKYPVDRVQELQRNSIGLTTQLQLARARFNSTEEWIAAIREALYRDFREQIERERTAIAGLRYEDLGDRSEEAGQRVRRFFERTNPVLVRIVEACSIRTATKVRANDQIGALLTSNLDGLLQLCDRACHRSRILRTVERANKAGHAGKVTLYHLHGYLQHVPRSPRREAGDRLVLTDDEYLERNDNPYSWASVILHWALREFMMVFVGCSMTDDLVRRALRRSAQERMAHFAAERPDRPLAETAWRRQFAVTQIHPDSSLNEAVNRSLGTLGVWPLWVADFGQDLGRRLSQLGLADLQR